MKAVPLLLAAAVLASCSTAPSTITRVTPLPTQDGSQPIATLQVAPTATLGLLEASATAVDVAGAVATPTPLDNNLAVGQARAVALATDTALQPTPRNPITFDQNPVPIKFSEFYDGYDMRTGLKLSDKLVSLDGKTASLEGYMAPPLKAELDYFVLTRIRLSFCPFCSTAADWPDDIALVYMPGGVTTVATDHAVRVIGRMEIGQSVDQETGMVSLVRLYADSLETLG